MRRGSVDPTPLELETCMDGRHPGSPENLVIVSFDKAFHGRSFGKTAREHLEILNCLIY